MYGRPTGKFQKFIPRSAIRIPHFFLKFVPDRRKVGILLSDVPKRLVQPKTCTQIRLGLIQVTKDSFITTQIVIVNWLVQERGRSTQQFFFRLGSLTELVQAECRMDKTEALGRE